MEVGYGFLEKFCFPNVSFASSMCIFWVTLFLESSQNADASLKEQQPCCDHGTHGLKEPRALMLLPKGNFGLSTSELLAVEDKQIHAWSNHWENNNTQPNFSFPLRVCETYSSQAVWIFLSNASDIKSDLPTNNKILTVSSVHSVVLNMSVLLYSHHHYPLHYSFHVVTPKLYTY